MPQGEGDFHRRENEQVPREKGTKLLRELLFFQEATSRGEQVHKCLTRKY
jgi:hypothetical protein